MRIRKPLPLVAAFVSWSLAASAQPSPPSTVIPSSKKPDPGSLVAASPPAQSKPAQSKPASSQPASPKAESSKPAPLGATPAKANAPPALTAEAREALMTTAKQSVDSADPAAVEQAFASLAALGGPDALKLVVARVRRGLPPRLVEPALSSLLAFRQPSTVPLLLELCTHRRWQVRQKAIETLGALNARTAQSSLLYALDDPSSDVRTAAVQALGLVGDARALPALTLALERGVDGASLALGRLGNTKEADLLLARARAANLVSVEPGLHAMMLRTNVSIATKLHIVRELSLLPGVEARECLAAWARSPGELDARVLSALSASAGRPVDAKLTVSAKAPTAVAGGKP